jgi:hypothetical protein
MANLTKNTHTKKILLTNTFAPWRVDDEYTTKEYLWNSKLNP